jgi:hypothetical protein
LSILLITFLTDQEIVKTLESVCRMFRGDDTYRDYAVLVWTLCYVLRTVVLWKKDSDTMIANCVDRLIHSVENHPWRGNPRIVLISSPFG